MIVNGKIISRHHSWPEYTKKSILNATMQPKLSAKVSLIKGQEKSQERVLVTLINDNKDSYPAIYATLMTDDLEGWFSNNVFFMLPGEKISVVFRSKVKYPDLKEKL